MIPITVDVGTVDLREMDDAEMVRAFYQLQFKCLNSKHGQIAL